MEEPTHSAKGSRTATAPASSLRRPSGMFAYLLLVTFTVFIIYVLSAGPVFGFYHNHMNAPGLSVALQLYAPLDFVIASNETVGNLLAHYVEWWWRVFE